MCDCGRNYNRSGDQVLFLLLSLRLHMRFVSECVIVIIQGVNEFGFVYVSVSETVCVCVEQLFYDVFLLFEKNLA